jgi:hypothetical protein
MMHGTGGFAGLDLQGVLASVASAWPRGEKVDAWSAKLGERPAQNTLVILGLAAAVFFAAERGVNPKVVTIFDALEYCSSSLSVGYTSIFPQTPLGKLVATFLMTYGPALSGAMLDGVKKGKGVEEKMVETLEAILVEVRRGKGE